MTKNRISEIMDEKALTPGTIIERLARLGHHLDRTRFYRLRQNDVELTLEEAHLFKQAFELDTTEALQESIIKEYPKSKKNV